MNILYIGEADGMAEVLIERMVRDGHEVSIISDKPLSKEFRAGAGHLYYRTPRDGEGVTNLLRSISPELVVFAGEHYLGDVKDADGEADISMLAHSLRTLADTPDVRLVLLSSTDVYGDTGSRAGENTPSKATSERGFRFMREEEMVDSYREKRGLNAVTLRASQVYTSKPEAGAHDFLSRNYTAAEHGDDHIVADIFQPLHVADLAEAVSRVLEASKDNVYNVAGDQVISAQELQDLIRRRENLPDHNVQWIEPNGVTLADTRRIREDLGWSDTRDLTAGLEEKPPAQGATPGGKAIAYSEAPKGSSDRIVESGTTSSARHIVLELVLFAAFFGVAYLCRSNPVFSQVNWLLIYVMLVSISSTMYQSLLAAVLSSVACLFVRGADAIAVVEIIQYFVFGLLICSATKVLRAQIHAARAETARLKKDYDELWSINDENVLIKNEFEERFLTKRAGFPRLYSLISRLLAQDPDRILMETMQVVSDLIDTPTVAVYQTEEGSPWLRLMGALTEGSAMEGKSWNLADTPEIYSAVLHGEVYQGDFGPDDPAVVLPIMYKGAPEAVILIKTLPYESESDYHVNLLKTLGLLLGDSMEKALHYEELSKADHYVEGTSMLKPDAFSERVELAQEKADKGMADFCIVEFTSSMPIKEMAAQVSERLRGTDCIGMNSKGKLLGLLNNTDPENIAPLKRRMEACGVQTTLVTDPSEWEVTTPKEN